MNPPEFIDDSYLIFYIAYVKFTILEHIAGIIRKIKNFCSPVPIQNEIHTLIRLASICHDDLCGTLSIFRKAENKCIAKIDISY